MKVLVACEFSGIVRDAFKARGHDAWSCDFLPSEKDGNHILGDVLSHLNEGWDLMIAHPPCTYLTVTGNRWFADKYLSRYPNRKKDRQKAIDFFLALANTPIKKIAIENPIGIMSSFYRKPDQIIQPYQFGHEARKATCLWLKNIPMLVPTNIVQPKIVTYANGKTMSLDYVSGVHRSKPGDSMKDRSRTYTGIAKAMAQQWG